VYVGVEECFVKEQAFSVVAPAYPTSVSKTLLTLKLSH
jgi:hypothetical protein